MDLVIGNKEMTTFSGTLLIVLLVRRLNVFLGHY